ncbi:hypothetical protein SCHPADRAFT_885906 [Schizopora paradoxa]|uniref:Fe2OG dioxygenase domain-containing protein n=1 Tax=Schizopora paradoxa TaxID=27342 RepID=A0A0H2S4A6_9AGAM|nr:hypothetical protein SCHPADRAFT_885906 [Schizopora paradoxa]
MDGIIEGDESAVQKLTAQQNDSEPDPPTGDATPSLSESKSKDNEEHERALQDGIQSSVDVAGSCHALEDSNGLQEELSATSPPPKDDHNANVNDTGIVTETATKGVFEETSEVSEVQMEGGDETEDNEDNEDEHDESADDEDDEDESASSDEEELPVVENPSQDIRNDLIAALEDNEDTAGTFFSAHSFSVNEAPNPLIHIEGFGVLGLPLSAPEAKRVISTSVTQQAPFGMGERTVIDKAVRDTWEIDGSKIHFGNPRWNTWLADVVVPHICGNLGVNVASTAPRAELYKLLLYETGSHTEKAPGMFATIVVVLPSEFSGGSLHLSHAGKTETIDIAANSLFATHALAWYTDVYHSVYPVTSGYRLALSYNLVHSKSFKPSLNLLTEKTATLRHILLSWKQAKEGRVASQKNVPDQLCYLLNHEYSQVNLLASALKGKDASIVAQFKPIAEELGFGLFVANIVLHKSGPGDDCGGGYHRDYYDDSDDDEGDDDDVDFVEVEEQTLSISNIVDLDGMPMQEEDVSVDMEDMIPGPFGEDEEPDEKEYEGYMGNWAGTLEHWYHRSVLIFCPDKDLFDVGNITDYACKTLASCTSSKPTRKEKKLANRLIVNCTSGMVPKEALMRAIGILTSAAVKWENIDLWTKAVSACPPDLKLQSVGIDGFARAYIAFGFIPLEKHLEAAIQGDTSNARRFSIVQGLSRLGTDDKNEALVNWCTFQQENILGSLRQATEQEVGLLVNLVKQRGLEFLRKSVLPQLTEAKSGISFWIAFLQKLKQDEIVDPQAPNPNEVAEIITSQVSTIMAAASTFPTKLIKAKVVYQKDRKEPYLDKWLRYITLCVTLGRSNMCSAYFGRMAVEYNKATQETKDWIADFFITSAIIKLGAEVSKFPPDSLGIFAEFFKFALDVYVNRTVIQGRGTLAIPTLLIAAQHAGGAEVLKAKLGPMYAQLAQKKPNEAQQMLSSIASKKSEVAPDHPDALVYQAIIDGLLKAIIALTDFEAKQPAVHRPSGYGYGYGYGGYGATTASTTVESAGFKLIKLCNSTGCQAHIPLILDRMLMPKASSDIRKQIEYGLVPLVPQLKTYLTSIGQAITNEPYASFAAKTIKGYVKNVLGPKPKETVATAQLKTVGCNACDACREMRRLFLSETKVFSMARNQNVRKHMERELEKTRAWGVTWTTIRSGSPQKLQITKPDSLVAPINWLKKQVEGLSLAESVGDEKALQTILGAHFATVAGVLGMKVTIQPAAPAHRQQTTASNAPRPAAGPSHPTAIIPATKKRPSTGGDQPPKRTKLDDDSLKLETDAYHKLFTILAPPPQASKKNTWGMQRNAERTRDGFRHHAVLGGKQTVIANGKPLFQHRRPTRIADLLIDAQPPSVRNAVDSVTGISTIAGLPDRKPASNELRSGESIATDATSYWKVETGRPGGTEDDDNDMDDEDEGNDGDTCSSDEEETPLVVNPPKNLRDELISALKDYHKTTGSFFSSRSFSAGDAPNPMIWIEDFGNLGLPLSISEARRLIGSNVVQQAPFGMGERTVVDKTVRDTWEVDGSKVRFCNSTWITWMNQVVVPHICKDLGVNRSSTLPGAELYKLLLYETGSHFLPHQDTAKSPGMFATIVVVLPSEFSGGSLHLSHAGETKTIDISTNSLMMTHALAWYTDVFHSVLPVQSGHRLALSFNLVHSRSVKPSLQIFAEKTARLKHILLSWKQASEGRITLDEKPPDKLCYVLDHEYSHFDFIEGERKGKDASLVAQLESIAMHLDFGIYIANIELYKQGPADDYRRKRKRYRAYEESEDEEDTDVGFAQVFEQKLEISNIVDLYGTSKAASKVSVKMSEIVPESFGTGEPDESEYDGYMGNGAGSLEHWYRSSVLLFTPDNDFFGVGDVVEHALASLPNVDSSRPSRKERKLVAILQESLSNGRTDTSRVQHIVPLLMGVAFKWSDLRIWTRAISACPTNLKLESVGSQGFVKACSVFGFESIKQHLQSALAEDDSNFHRFTIVEELSKLGISKADEALKQWCRSQREMRLI